MARVMARRTAHDNGGAARRRPDYQMIAALVPAGARVLDLGCGDGQLLALLEETKGCRVQGIEILEQAATACIQRGVPVYHGDMLEGMSFLSDGAFDVVILSQTLQQTMRPLVVLHEMLRVGRRAIISFPNFGYWRTRLQLLLSGRMPRHDLLPYPWYETPNVHLCTILDFCELCEQEGLAITEQVLLTPSHRPISPFLANWRAGLAIMQVERNGEAKEA
jgi:methionine biosynthesis protein MetW